MARKIALTITLLAIGLFALPAHARESVEARIAEEGDSGVAGTALFSHAPPDTIGHVELNGLKPGSAARIAVHEGSCSRLSASFVTLAEVAGDAKGKATGDGLLLLRGSESVEFRTIADGGHSVSVAQDDKTVACGAVPKQGTEAAAPGSDAPPPWNTYAAIATGVLVAAGAILFVFQRKRKKAKSAT